MTFTEAGLGRDMSLHKTPPGHPSAVIFCIWRLPASLCINSLWHEACRPDLTWRWSCVWHMVNEGSVANYAFFELPPWLLRLDRGFLGFEPHVLLFWPRDGPNFSGYWNERCHCLQSDRITVSISGLMQPKSFITKIGTLGLGGCFWKGLVEWSSKFNLPKYLVSPNLSFNAITCTGV